MKIRGSASELRDPKDSTLTNVRIEDGGDCDGSVCRQLDFDEFGEELYPMPHHHLVESGVMPEAGPRFYPI